MWLRNYSHCRERTVTQMLKLTINDRKYRKGTGVEDAEGLGRRKRSTVNFPQKMKGFENICRDI